MKQYPVVVGFASVSRIDSQASVSIARMIERFEQFILDNTSHSCVATCVRDSSAAKCLINLGAVVYPDICTHIEQHEDCIADNPELCQAWVRLFHTSSLMWFPSSKKPIFGSFDRQELCAWVMWARAQGKRYE